MKKDYFFFFLFLALIGCEQKNVPIEKKLTVKQTDLVRKTEPGIKSSKPSEWIEEKGVRYKKLEVPKAGKEGFTLLSPEMTKISFQNTILDEEVTQNQILQNGSGVATGDFDNDGLCDIYFCRLTGDNALYKNLGGWKFQDVTAKAGVACPNQFSTGATFADLDGDRDLDLLVTCVGSLNTCFINNGNGTFTPNPHSGLNTNSGSMSVALADIEGDGDLDLYVTNYRASTFKDFGKEISLNLTSDGKIIIPPQLQNRLIIDGEITIPKEDMANFYVDGKVTIPLNYQKKLMLNRNIKEFGEVDTLYLNDGKGNFQLLSFTDGNFLDEEGNKLKEPPRDWGLSVIFKDMDNDLDPDMYICNDFWSPDRIWINQGNKTFRAIDCLAIRSTSATSMGVDFSDIDRDGFDDFFVVDMMARDHKRRKMQMGTMQPTPIQIGLIDNRPQIMRNTLFKNRGDNTYAEIALYAEVHDTEWSWAPLFLDIDLDGYEDLYVTNGHARDVMDSDTNNRIQTLDFQTVTQKRMAMLMYPRLKTPNVAMKNLGNLKFEDKGEEWGLNQETVTHGVATGDFDNDGDLDLIINNMFSPAGVYRNEIHLPRIAVQLKGQAPNTQGIGAKITLRGASVLQTKEILSGGRYLSGSDTRITFAPGQSTEGLQLEVLWRNGRKSVLSGVKPNTLYEIDEAGSQPSELPNSVPIIPTFKDVSEKIAHIHTEAPFDDFQYQSMLPNRFSQLGPGVAWYDINGDRQDDLIIGSGRTGTLAIFHNEGQGNFKRDTTEILNATALRDHTAIAAYKNENGVSSLIVGTSNFEEYQTDGAGALLYQFQEGTIELKNAVPCQPSSTGPLALADIDGDGDLDLFVGDRTLAKRYPEPVSSRIFLNQEGVFTLDTNNSAKLEKIGLVSGAIFSDLDSDGDPDLVLALEWGPSPFS
ncbi:MAG: CRTAC1 family protein [Planctomycetota bacterium]